MKNLVKLILAGVCLLYLFGCQKDEEKQRTAQTIELIEVDTPEDIPLHLRNGGAQFVIWNNYVVSHVFINLYPQYGFDPDYIDSIEYIKVFPIYDALIKDDTGKEKLCEQSNTTFHMKPPLLDVLFENAYSPYYIGDKKVIYPNSNGFNQLFAYFEFQIGGTWVDRFDKACKKVKRDYSYRTNYHSFTDSVYTEIDTLQGNRDCLNVYRLKFLW